MKVITWASKRLNKQRRREGLEFPNSGSSFENARNIILVFKKKKKKRDIYYSQCLFFQNIKKKLFLKIGTKQSVCYSKLF